MTVALGNTEAPDCLTWFTVKKAVGAAVGDALENPEIREPSGMSNVQCELDGQDAVEHRYTQLNQRW